MTVIQAEEGTGDTPVTFPSGPGNSKGTPGTFLPLSFPNQSPHREGMARARGFSAPCLFSKLVGAFQFRGIFSVGKIVIKLAFGFLIKGRGGPGRRGAVSAGRVGRYPPPF